jgi:uncharacterized membrane protein YgcG
MWNLQRSLKPIQPKTRAAHSFGEVTGSLCSLLNFSWLIDDFRAELRIRFKVKKSSVVMAAVGMNLGVVSSLGNLVLDCHNASKWRGTRALLYYAHGGAANQEFVHDEHGRLVPQHAPGLCLDVKGGAFKDGAVLHFWVIKSPAALNQQFVLDSTSGHLIATGSGGAELVVGSLETGSGARLCIVGRGHPGALQFEWRAPHPSQRDSASSRPTLQLLPPPPPHASSSSSSTPQTQQPHHQNPNNSGRPDTYNNSSESSSSSSSSRSSNSSSNSSGNNSGNSSGDRTARTGGSGDGSGSSGGGSSAGSTIPEAVAAALAAEDYYVALGLEEAKQFELDDSSVRRAYLKVVVG